MREHHKDPKSIPELPGKASRSFLGSPGEAFGGCLGRGQGYVGRPTLLQLPKISACGFIDTFEWLLPPLSDMILCIHIFMSSSAMLMP